MLSINQRGQYSVGIPFTSITADSDDLCISVGEIEDIQRESCKGGKQETIDRWEGQMIAIAKRVEEKIHLRWTFSYTSEHY